MKANDLVERMEALRPDSMDVLDLIDEADNFTIRIWKESTGEYHEYHGDLTYYRIRIQGRAGLVFELFPDTVTASMSDLQLYTETEDGNDEALTGIIDVSTWKVMGE